MAVRTRLPGTDATVFGRVVRVVAGLLADLAGDFAVGDFFAVPEVVADPAARVARGDAALAGAAVSGTAAVASARTVVSSRRAYMRESP